MDVFCQQFEAAIPKLRQQILDEFNNHQTQSGYRSVWEHFEDIINPVLIRFFSNLPLSIHLSNIKAAKSKSVYPDLKINFRGNDYAIDVKSGEDHINPWYDIGRLDTYEESHLQKYASEYCITVRWKNREAPQVVDVYIEPTYKSVGYREESKGVLYRPYDGKLRPKPWSDFEIGKTYWQDIEHFKQGLKLSRNYRRRSYIAEWYKEMDRTQREALKRDLAAIDTGEAVNLDKDISVDSLNLT